MDEDEEVVGDENLEVEEEADDPAVEEEADETQEAEQGDGDEGQGVHNDAVAKTVCAKAIVIMAKKGITIDAEEECEACTIFPRACFYLFF